MSTEEWAVISQHSDNSSNVDDSESVASFKIKLTKKKTRMLSDSEDEGVSNQGPRDKVEDENEKEESDSNSEKSDLKFKISGGKINRYL